MRSPGAAQRFGLAGPATCGRSCLDQFVPPMFIVRQIFRKAALYCTTHDLFCGSSRRHTKPLNHQRGTERHHVSGAHENNLCRQVSFLLRHPGPPVWPTQIRERHLHLTVPEWDGHLRIFNEPEPRHGRKRTHRSRTVKCSHEHYLGNCSHRWPLSGKWLSVGHPAKRSRWGSPSAPPTAKDLPSEEL